MIDVSRVRNEISEALPDAILDVIEPPIWREMDVEANVDGARKKIVEVSALAYGLVRAQRDHYRLVVYSPKEEREETALAVSRILG